MNYRNLFRTLIGIIALASIQIGFPTSAHAFRMPGTCGPTSGGSYFCAPPMATNFQPFYGMPFFPGAYPGTPSPMMTGQMNSYPFQSVWNGGFYSTYPSPPMMPFYNGVNYGGWSGRAF